MLKTINENIKAIYSQRSISTVRSDKTFVCKCLFFLIIIPQNHTELVKKRKYRNIGKFISDINENIGKCVTIIAQIFIRVERLKKLNFSFSTSTSWSVLSDIKEADSLTVKTRKTGNNRKHVTSLGMCCSYKKCLYFDHLFF